MYDYHRLRIKLLGSSDGGSALGLKLWIALPAATFWLLLFILRDNFHAGAFIYLGALWLLFLAHLAESYPRLGVWAVIVSCSLGSLASTFVMYTVWAQRVEESASSVDFVHAGVYLLYCMLVLQASIRYRKSMSIHRHPGSYP